MVKVNIERHTVEVPAPYLPAGTFFQYKNETRESSHGFLLKVDTTDRAVNLYTGNIVPVLDAPYEVIQGIEIKGWV